MAKGKPPSSSGLGHRPFKAEARVRIPLGARHHHICARRGVRSSSPPCQGGDRGIEARRARWASESETARSPVYGEVAQLVEHAAENRGVGGPIPPLPTRMQRSTPIARSWPRRLTYATSSWRPRRPNSRSTARTWSSPRATSREGLTRSIPCRSRIWRPQARSTARAQVKFLTWPR